MKSAVVSLERQKEMYILYGESGEYDYYVQWTVGIFKTEGGAKKYKEYLEQDARDHFIALDISYQMHTMGTCPPTVLDKKMIECWTGFGVEYSYTTIKVLD